MVSLRIMKYLKIIVLSLLLLCANACKNSNTDSNTIIKNKYNAIIANSVDKDYNTIKKEGVLKAMVVYSSTSYFLYKGQTMGYEYELLQLLANDLNLDLKLVISNNLDEEFEALNRGDVDLVAHGMTITNKRKWEVDFTEYLYLTKQVLVQKKPDNFRQLSWKKLNDALIHDPLSLIDDTVSVRKNSAYYERLVNLCNEIGGNIVIDTLNSALSTGEIMDMVADGEVKYTIADENLAKINASSQPILDTSVPISLSQRIAWVTRKKSRKFREILDNWIIKNRNTIKFRVLYNKYFKNKRSFKRREKSDYYSLTNNQISAYDDIIKKYAKIIEWDWRLLASQIYQESKFDVKANSWAGAEGLMQIMPLTAKSLGVKNILNPEESISAGTKYLLQNYKAFNKILDETNRIKFTLAAYNCGLGHVMDAQRLAKSKGLNPNIWSGNVENMLLALRLPGNYKKSVIKYGYVRGTEPVNYVNQIFDRFSHYQEFISL